MNRFIQQWLKTAKRDLRAARTLKGSADYSNSIYHLQQAFEKILKCYHAHLLIEFQSTTEKQAEINLISLGHFTKESALKLILKLCELEDRKWAEKGTNGKIHNLKDLMPHLDPTILTNPDLKASAKIVKMFHNSLEGFKRKISEQLNKKTDAQSLIIKYPTIVNGYYTKYKKLETQIGEKQAEIIERNKLGIESMSEASYRFQYLVKNSEYLANSLSGLESDSRYPKRKFNYKNIEILNRPEMKAPCCQLFEILDHLLQVVEKDIS